MADTPSAALPEIRVEEMPCHLHGTDYRAECEFCQGAYADREMENLRADRDRLQRRVEELEEQVQRVATVAQAFGESRRHMDGLERCREIARAALTSETPQ